VKLFAKGLAEREGGSEGQIREWEGEGGKNVVEDGYPG